MNILHCSRNTLSRVSPYHSKQKYDTLRHQNRSPIFWLKIIFPSWFPTFLFSWMTAAAVAKAESRPSWEYLIHITFIGWGEQSCLEVEHHQPNQTNTHLPVDLIHICHVFRVRARAHQGSRICTMSCYWQEEKLAKVASGHSMAYSSEAAYNITVDQGSITVATNFWVTVEVSQWSTEGLAQFLRSPQPIKTCQHGAAEFLPAQFWTPPKSEKETQLWCALYAWHYSYWALFSVHDCNH